MDQTNKENMTIREIKEYTKNLILKNYYETQDLIDKYGNDALEEWLIQNCLNESAEEDSTTNWS